MRLHLGLHAAITSGVRKLTLLRAVVPLEMRFALMGIDYAIAEAPFSSAQRSAEICRPFFVDL